MALNGSQQARIDHVRDARSISDILDEVRILREVQSQVKPIALAPPSLEILALLRVALSIDALGNTLRDNGDCSDKHAAGIAQVISDGFSNVCDALKKD